MEYIDSINMNGVIPETECDDDNKLEVLIPLIADNDMEIKIIRVDEFMDFFDSPDFPDNI